MKDKLIIFADYGLDDAAATVNILNHSKRFENITIVPIGGNVPVKMAYKNCFTLLNHFPNLLNKITVVDTLDINQPNEYLADIHGKDGMGDIMEPVITALEVTVIKFDKWLDTLSGDEIVLSLGPMTLVRKVMERYKCKLIIMGGCVNEEPNFKGYEFNHCLDTEAFSYCVKHPHVAITLDTCRTEKLNIRGAEITGDDLYSRILKADQDLSLKRGEEGCYVWDDVAACYLLYPERFELTPQQDPYSNIITNAIYISNKSYYL